MEYLMTYGWAILVIAVVLGVLFQLGVFSSTNFSPRAPPGACRILRTTASISLVGQCSGQLPQNVGQFTGDTVKYVAVQNSNALQLQVFTLTAWVSLTSVGSSWNNIVGFGTQYGASQRYGYNFYINQGDTQLSAIVGPAGGGTIGVSLGAPSINTWHFLSMTYDAANVQGYTDGVSQGSVASSNVVYGAMGFDIGYNGNGNFNGLITNVQVYNVALSPGDIQSLYLEGMGGAPIKPQNTLGWWPMNGNANDYSGNNNDGVQYGVGYTSQYGK
jgi:hypothetical protein